MLLEDVSPSVEVLPSPWQAPRVGAMTSVQPGAELQGCSGLFIKFAPPQVPPAPDGR